MSVHGQEGRLCQSTVAEYSLIDVPFKRVAVDLVGPIFPPSNAGHRYILTFIDYATRYPEAIPLKTISTESVAEALVGIYSRVGVPEEVLSDLGIQFISDCMKEVSRLLSIRQLTTTPYYPMCSGLVEKFNGTLKTMLRRLCTEKPRQWNRYIDALSFAYREAPHESTGFSPFELIYGRTVRGPMRILRHLWTQEGDDVDVRTSYRYVIELRERLEDTLRIAHEELQKAQRHQKRYYDLKARHRELSVGDKALVLLPTDTNKLLMKWKGPYVVKERVGLNDYRIDVGGKTKVYHINLLKRFHEREKEAFCSMEEHKGGPVLNTVCSAVIEATERVTGEAVINDELLDLCSCLATETFEDVKYGSELSSDQVSEAAGLVKELDCVFTEQRI